MFDLDFLFTGMEVEYQGKKYIRIQSAGAEGAVLAFEADAIMPAPIYLIQPDKKEKVPKDDKE